MKRLLWLVGLVAIAAGGWWQFAREPGAGEVQQGYRTVTVGRGDIVAQVSTTGTVTPITTVIVGSQLSGQVVEILADYNSEVKAGQLLARLNADQIKARLDAARAELAAARAARVMLDAQLEKSNADIVRADAVSSDMKAQLSRSETQLADAEKTLARQTDLASQGITAATTLQASKLQRDTLISQRQSALAQIESAKAQKLSLQADQKVLTAQMVSSDAQIQQRAAMVKQIEVDLTNTDIRSPVDGVVVQRNVELGQPVAASLQAPTLFLVAQDLRKIQIQANVDEADVGRVQENQTVSFNVNAYPGRTFEGVVKQVRLGSQTVQNVVIYTTVIEVENPRLELKPGMTANLRILTDRRQNVLRIPNAALRWRPPANLEQPTPAMASSPASAAQRSPDGEVAENAAGPFAGQGGRGGGRGLFVERLKAELDLTETQRRDIDKLLADMPDTGRTGGNGGGRQAREAFAEKVMTLLNDEQKIKFAAMQERARASAQGGGRGGAGGGGGGGRRASANPGEAPQTVITGRVYRLGANGAPVGVTIRLGVSDGAFTEVVSGLSENDQLIVGGGPPPPKTSTFRFGL